jgi:hypothetical protein
MATLDTETLRAALIGYQQQLDGIYARMAEIRRVLGAKAPTGPAPSAKSHALKKRTISAAGRARIAAAQRKRWAEAKKQAAPSQPAKPKRRLSAAGRKAIIAATKKRWALIRAEKEKAS